MAVSVLPPFSALHADLTHGAFSLPNMDSLTSLSCALQPRACLVKTEPDDTAEDSMDTTTSSTTYTELSSANFSQIKQGHTDLYADSGEGQALRSWTFKHPEHWEAREVLDWLFSLTDTDNLDGAVFRGEAYNTVTGRQLCDMTLADFLDLDPNHGARVYEVFQVLLRDANFNKPALPETFRYETLCGNIPHFAFLECSNAVTPPSTPPPPSPPSSDSQLAVFLKGKEVKVSLHGLGLYDIDLISDPQSFDLLDDSDYHSGSDVDLDRSNSVTSEVFNPMFSDDDESTNSDVIVPDVIASCRTPTPSTSSDSGDSEGGEERRCSSGRRRQQSSSKGNHLWEFVRDLLKDSHFNPSLVRWEDKDLGVFKFVQSEAVASMWGRKKNNPGMTYEKLSRAMRFCRSAGYFDSVPKTGRFPKKLCFRFGPKAHDWRD